MNIYKSFIKLNQHVKHIRYYTIQERSYEEIKIPVSWGHISGKWWGPKNKRPILGIHGWQDNCGSFDPLAPFIAPHVGFLAVDLPGHGWSSKLPPGAVYHTMDFVTIVKRIVQYFNWSKVSLLGHSMGGIISCTYSVLHPTTIDFLICLDAIKPAVFDLEELDNVAKYMSYLIKYEKLNSATTEPPSYTFEELEQALHAATGKSLELHACKHILKRNIAPSKVKPNKFYMTRDLRLKLPTYWLGVPNDFAVDTAYKLTCPTFLSRSNCRTFPFQKKLQGDDVIEIVKKTNRNFELHHIEGTHHAHINNPEHFVDIINKFIEKYDVENRSLESNSKHVK